MTAAAQTAITQARIILGHDAEASAWQEIGDKGRAFCVYVAKVPAEVAGMEWRQIDAATRRKIGQAVARAARWSRRLVDSGIARGGDQ